MQKESEADKAGEQMEAMNSTTTPKPDSTASIHTSYMPVISHKTKVVKAKVARLLAF
jgi:hypothetical protein